MPLQALASQHMQGMQPATEVVAGQFQQGQVLEQQFQMTYGKCYGAIAVAYPVFTFGALFAGMIWAHFAWGAWWSWDPKEVGSLVAWFLYTLYLHQRYRERLSPRAAAVFAMLGFLFATLSLAGNAFLGGLHAYS